MNQVSIELLRQIFCYDPKTGELTNLVRRKMQPAGAVSGWIDKKGYRAVRVGTATLKVHRLAWAMYFGRWPENEIDHANRNKLDNRISNLREAERSDNQQNKGIYSTNSSGFKGVNWHKRTGRWHARVMREGRRIHLGSFKTKEDAAQAYRESAKYLHGEFFADT